MKTVFHYINWALHDINRFVWKSFVWPTIKFNSFSILFYAVAFVPIFIPGVSMEFMFAWAGFAIVFMTFVLITYYVYWERRRLTPPEPVILVDYQFGKAMVAPPPPLPKPFTLKESLSQGYWWTKYLFGVLIIAGIITGVFGSHIADFINHIR